MESSTSSATDTRCGFSRAFREELRTVFTDEGALLLLFFALLIYAAAYGVAYGAQVVRNVPIGVIDESRTAASRRLVSLFDAGPDTFVAYAPTDMEEARELLFRRKIYGIVYIPSDYERRLLDGEPADVAIYADASYFLLYRQVFQELAATIGLTGAQVGLQRLVARGTDLPQAEAVVQPVAYRSANLFNPYLGYASFVMPAILVVIIQQTLLIGVGLIGGTRRERQPAALAAFAAPGGLLRRMAGRTAAYLTVYGVTMAYAFGLQYRLFHYPDNGSAAVLLLFLLLYLLAAAALAQALAVHFRRREDSLLLLLWSSIPVLMISGVSFPREGMPGWLYALGQLLPSSHAIDGVIRIRSMGASLGEVLPQVMWLLLLTLLYGGWALYGARKRG